MARQQFEKKTDCKMYNKETNSCNALKELYCKKEKCGFYKPRKENKR